MLLVVIYFKNMMNNSSAICWIHISKIGPWVLSSLAEQPHNKGQCSLVHCQPQVTCECRWIYGWGWVGAAEVREGIFNREHKQQAPKHLKQDRPVYSMVGFYKAVIQSTSLWRSLDRCLKAIDRERPHTENFEVLSFPYKATTGTAMHDCEEL